MKTDIGIWEIDRASRVGTKLGFAQRIETEEMLEDVLVANPNMLMRGLSLVGRQLPVEAGLRSGTEVMGEIPSSPSGWCLSASGSMSAPIVGGDATALRAER